MKKLILTIILFLCVLFQINAQSRYHVYMVRSGPYNNYSGQYDTNDHMTNMTIEFDNSVVRISDNARSVYIVRNYQEIKNDNQGNIAKWDGIDEKGRNVGVYMTFNKVANESSLAIVYNDYMFQYFFNE